MVEAQEAQFWELKTAEGPSHGSGKGTISPGMQDSQGKYQKNLLGFHWRKEEKESTEILIHQSVVVQPLSCVWLFVSDLMDCNTPAFPILHHLLECARTHVHWASDAIQPSHPLSFPSPLPSIFPSIRVFSSESVLRILCQSIGASASASVLPMNIQNWFPLGWTGWISLLSKGLPRVFSNTTVQKHQFFGAQPSL